MASNKHKLYSTWRLNIMAFSVVRSYEWKCNNTGDFKLAWDGEKRRIGWGWGWRTVVYHCPICIYYKEVPIESVKNFLD